MSKIMWICPKCGRRNVGNKCKCGYEILPETPKTIKRKKTEGVFY